VGLLLLPCLGSCRTYQIARWAIDGFDMDPSVGERPDTNCGGQLKRWSGCGDRRQELRRASWISTSNRHDSYRKPKARPSDLIFYSCRCGDHSDPGSSAGTSISAGVIMTVVAAPGTEQTLAAICLPVHVPVSAESSANAANSYVMRHENSYT
jgi:hypothetical protein